jgi:hypothetical protein
MILCARHAFVSIQYDDAVEDFVLSQKFLREGDGYCCDQYDGCEPDGVRSE